MNATSLEVHNVAGGKRCAAGSGNGGDLRIELSHRPACLTAFGRELGIGMCSGFVEGSTRPAKSSSNIPHACTGKPRR
jgi:hypothetical protein